MRAHKALVRFDTTEQSELALRLRHCWPLEGAVEALPGHPSCPFSRSLPSSPRVVGNSECMRLALVPLRCLLIASKTRRDLTSFLQVAQHWVTAAVLRLVGCLEKEEATIGPYHLYVCGASIAARYFVELLTPTTAVFSRGNHPKRSN